MYLFHIVVCPFVLFVLAIVLYVLLRFPSSDYPFGIFKLFILTVLNCSYIVLLSHDATFQSFIVLSCSIHCFFKRHPWSWSYGGWMYMYSQCLSSLKLCVISLSWWGVIYKTLCDKICQWLVTDLWVSSINKNERHDVTEKYCWKWR